MYFSALSSSPPIDRARAALIRASRFDSPIPWLEDIAMCSCKAMATLSGSFFGLPLRRFGAARKLPENTPPGPVSNISLGVNMNVAQDIVANYRTGIWNGRKIDNKNYKDAKNIFETEYLQVQIKKFAGNISKTASFIGLDRTALHRKLRTLQISNEDNDEK